MQLTLDILDGKYSVQSHAQNGHALIPHGDDHTTIQNGMTFHKDANGFIWESQFTIINDHQVEVVTTVDPSHGDSAAFVIDANGNPTKGMVTYKAVLDASHDSGTLVLRGDIHHSDSVTTVVLTKAV